MEIFSKLKSCFQPQKLSSTFAVLGNSCSGTVRTHHSTGHQKSLRTSEMSAENGSTGGPSVTLRNGRKVPMLGIGTWRLQCHAANVVRDAIDVGYRHLDCAHIYRNEAEVGEALTELLGRGVLKRENIFVTSKLWSTFHHPDMVRKACETSLRNLGLTYLDNYLIHWPMAYKDGDELYPKDENGKFIFSNVDFTDTWCAMEDLVDEGLCHTIGLSNFNKSQMERIMSMARIQPAILQIECHPYLNQQAMMDFCKAQEIAVTAYSPLGSPSTPYEKPGEYPILQHPQIREIAEKYQRSPAQILLRYQLQRGNIVVVRSVNKKHMIDNYSICDFELSGEDMDKLNSMDFGGRYMIMADAKGHPDHPFDTEH